MDSVVTNLFSQHFAGGNYTWMIFVLAFLGGVITSVSPCSLGLLPVVVGYVGGSSASREKGDFKSAIQILFFIVGLSLMLTIVGIFCAMTGKVFGSQSGPIWSIIMASLILVFGLNLLEVLHIPMPVIIKKMPQNKGNNLILYPIMIGAAFAFATTPCSTPILAGILAYASMKANIMLGASLLFLFSLGQGLILVIAGLFTSVFKKVMKLNAVSGYFVKFSGIILIIASFIIYFKVFEIF
jgi:cytochrome c-type biogenesis protein